VARDIYIVPTSGTIDFKDTGDITYQISSSGNDLIISGSGNVGIGISPSYDLHIKSSTTDAVLAVEPSTYVGTETAIIRLGDGNRQIKTVRGEVTEYRFYNGHAFYVSNEEILRITQTGNVGIGTTNPSVKLTVHGDALITGSLTVNGILTAQEFHTSYVSSSIVYASGSTKFGDTGDDIHQFTGSIRQSGSESYFMNNVGIGTTNPATALHVSGVLSVVSPGSEATAVGLNAGQSWSGAGGGQNTAFGFATLQNTVAGARNTAVGNRTLRDNTTGNNNVGLGYQSLVLNQSGSGNMAIGYYTLAHGFGASNNTAIGASVLNANTIGYNNVAVGAGSLYANTTAPNNVAVGYYAMNANITGTGNTAIGYVSLRFGTSGSYNTAVGYNSLDSVSGTGNTGMGFSVGSNITTGRYNTLFGYATGGDLTTGDYNIAIGYNVELPSATGDYQLNIGNTIYANMSTDYVGIGTASPQEKLHVDGNVSGSYAYFDRIGIGTTDNGTFIVDAQGGQIRSTRFQVSAGSYFTSNRMYFTGDTKILQYNGTATIDRYYFDTHTGNLGIGSEIATDGYIYAEESSSLHVWNNVTASAFYGDGSNLTGISADNAYWTGSAGEIHRMSYVGIGITNPANKLHIHNEDSSNTYIQMTTGESGTTGGDGLSIGYTSDETAIVWNRENTPLRFATNTTERMRIEAGGNVGIGTTNASTKLHISSSAFNSHLLIDRTGITGIDNKYGLTVSWNGATDYFTIVNSAAERLLKLTESGKLGVGLMGSVLPTVELEVHGDALITGSLTVNGLLTAQEFHTSYVSSSIVYASGSTKFGDSADDVHQFTGSLMVSGSATINDYLYLGTANTASGAEITFDAETTIGLRLENTHGYVSITPLNAGWAHIYTDRSRFIFNKDVVSYTGVFSAYSTNDMVFNTNTSTEQMRIVASTGNVGINTTAPATLLDVNGTSRFRDDMQITGSVKIYDADPVLLIQDSDPSVTTARPTLRLAESGAGGVLDNYWDLVASASFGSNFGFNIVYNPVGGGKENYLKILTSGEVGIGTELPEEQLHVWSNISASEFYGDGSNLTGISADNLGDVATSASLWKLSSADEVYVSDTSRYVGIGTTNPSQKLEVYTNGADNYMWIHEDAGTHDAMLRMRRGGTDWYMGIKDDSNLQFSRDIGEGTPFNNLLRLNYSGYVEISSSEFYPLRIHGNGSGTGIQWYNDGTVQWNTYVASGNFIFHDGSNIIMTIEDGADANTLYIDDTSRVGIGTNTPATELTVVGAISASSYIKSDTYGYFKGSDDGSSAIVLKLGRYSNTGTSMVDIYTNDLSADSMTIELKRYNADFIFKGNYPGQDNLIVFDVTYTTGGQLKLQNNYNIQTVLINSSGSSYFRGGSVGIGTTNPTEKLHVAGDIYTTADLHVADTLHFGSIDNDTFIDYVATDNLQFYAGGTLLLDMTLGVLGGQGIINWDGEISASTAIKTDRIQAESIGIGTASPEEDLHVWSNVSASEFYGDGSNLTGLTADNAYWTASAGEIHRMSNVGIGTNNPLYALDVVGDIRTDATLRVGTNLVGSSGVMVISGVNEIYGQENSGYTDPVYTFTNDADTGMLSPSGVNRLAFVTAGIPAIDILANQNVGIGTTNPSVKLEVAGDALITGSLTVDGLLIAQEFHTSYVSSSIIYSSGSTQFGDSSDDVHEFTGFISQTGLGESTYIGSNVGRNDDLTDNENVGLGFEALYTNTSGYMNIAIGHRSLYSNTAGHLNIAIGTSTMYANDEGDSNTAIGSHALYWSSGSQNTAVGDHASYYLRGGTTNVSIGYWAGGYYGVSTELTQATASIFIGQMTKANADAEENQIVIGSSAIGVGSNSVVLGNDSIATTVLKGNVGIGITNPPRKLVVNGGGISVFDDNSEGISLISDSITFSDENEDNVYQYLSSNTYHEFSVGGGVEFSVGANGSNFSGHITGSGNLRILGKVGIGTQAILEKLHVDGDIYTTADLHVNETIHLGSRDNNTYIDYSGTDNIDIRANGSSGVYIKSGGNVGIGMTDPQEQLHVAGNITASRVYTPYLHVGANETYDHYLRISQPASDEDVQIQGYINYTPIVADISLQVSGGYVGIGTTDPLEKLHVSGSVYITDDLHVTDTIYMGSRDNNTYIDYRATDYIDMYANGNLSLTLSPTGLVGIGTTDPSEKLHVVGDIYTTADLHVADTIYFGTIGNNTYIDYVATDNIDIRANGSSGVYIKSGGNVGIGTTAPVTDLHVWSSISASSISTDGIIVGGSAGEYNIRNEFDDGMVIDSTNRKVYLTVDGTHKLTISNEVGGDVGIGTDTPMADFHAWGNVSASNFYGDGSNITGVPPDTAFSSSIAGRVSTNETDIATHEHTQLYLDADRALTLTATGDDAVLTLTSDQSSGTITMDDNEGDMVFNTTNVFSFLDAVEITGNLTVAGAINATGEITAYYTSDYRLKNNKITISNPVEKIKAIEGIEFDWIDDEHVPEHRIGTHDVGLIAQDVQKILPEVVREVDGYMSLDYAKIVPLLVEAIKEQQKQIDRLEKLVGKN